MRKILLVDTNTAFTSDVESRLILDTIPETDVITVNSYENMTEIIQNAHPTELMISAKMLMFHPDWDFGLPVKCYAKCTEDIQKANECRIPCIGIVKTARELCKSIEENRAVEIVKKEPKQSSSFNTQQSETNPIERQKEQQVQKHEYNLRPEPKAYAQNQQTQEYNSNSRPESYPPKQPMKEHGFNSKAESYSQNSYEDIHYRDNEYNYNNDRKERQYSDPFEQMNQNPLNQSRYKEAVDYNTPQNETLYHSRLAKAKEEEARRREAEFRREQQYEAEQKVEAAMGNTKKPAKVITVYSAKGGVGKTTISCELATFLALTSHGRGRFKVCIADFNIDFGDVLNTLSYNSEKACMTYWAADIQAQIEEGKHPNEINYTESQISMYLQKNEKDGLYALIAPLTNEDSMDITETQLEIMMNNLIYHGGFDFVICDTGNNTRDSSILALEKADDVLLVITQDVNTAICNTSFLSTMRKVGFDMNKIHLLINKARPAKTVSVSTEELEESFINPNTGKPYHCIAKIKDNTEVKQANNTGTPLIYNSSHEFTRSIGVIAKSLIGDTFALGKPEKKGIFKKMFGKK